MDLIDELRNAAAYLESIKTAISASGVRAVCFHAAAALSAQRQAWRMLREQLGLPAEHPDGSDVLPRVERLRGDHEAMEAIRKHGWLLIRCEYEDWVSWRIRDSKGQDVWIDGKCNREWDDPVRAITAAEAARGE